MHLDYLIKHMDKQSKDVVFPRSNPGFDAYQVYLQRVLEENCGAAIAKSLVYCEHTQTFMVRVRAARELELPVRGPENMPQKCNLIFECVRTIDPALPLSPQLGILIDFVAQTEKQHAAFAKSFAKP